MQSSKKLIEVVPARSACNAEAVPLPGSAPMEALDLGRLAQLDRYRTWTLGKR
jgi:hypothetical protein